MRSCMKFQVKIPCMLTRPAPCLALLLILSFFHKMIPVDQTCITAIQMDH